MEEKSQSRLTIIGKLPFEDFASDINIGDLAKILVNRNVLTVEDYELLVMRGHMFPRLDAMNDSNWRKIKAELLKFLDKKNWRRDGNSSGKKQGPSQPKT